MSNYDRSLFAICGLPASEVLREEKIVINEYLRYDRITGTPYKKQDIVKKYFFPDGKGSHVIFRDDECMYSFLDDNMPIEERKCTFFKYDCDFPEGYLIGIKFNILDRYQVESLCCGDEDAIKKAFERTREVFKEIGIQKAPRIFILPKGDSFD